MSAFVKRLVADRWVGVLCYENETLAPTLVDTYQAINQLDAKTRTLVSLYGEDGSYLCVGGGSGRYVVYISTAEEQLWNLYCDTDDGKQIVLLNAGGQEGDFPSRQVVDRQRALTAAGAFLTEGRMDSTLRWIRQDPD